MRNRETNIENNKEMSEIQSKYGVNTFLSEVHVNAVDFDETFKVSEYQHIVEIKHIQSHNGNGHNEMKIYTDGKLEAFEIGNWKISPIIRMPFNWTGYSDVLEIQDNNAKIISYRSTPDPETLFSKKDFVKDIKWVFETIKLLGEIENGEHFELINHIKETVRILSIYKTGARIDTVLKTVEWINYEIETLNKLTLSEKSQSAVKIKINEAIDLFNEMYLKRLD